MDSFIEKFNLFDLFTTLIPGIIISALFGISLYSQYDSLWLSLGNEKYVVFFIFSYLCGVIFQEFGNMTDHIFLYKVLYGGNPREVFLVNEKCKKCKNCENCEKCENCKKCKIFKKYKKCKKYKTFFDYDLSYENALKVKEYFINYFNIKDADDTDQKKLNSLIFTYCLNMSEMKKITSKADKIIVISEMSRSLFWGCISTIILNIYMTVHFSYSWQFYFTESAVLFILSGILLYRKFRYERYRLRILLRTFLMYIKENTDT